MASRRGSSDEKLSGVWVLVRKGEPVGASDLFLVGVYTTKDRANVAAREVVCDQLDVAPWYCGDEEADARLKALDQKCRKRAHGDWVEFARDLYWDNEQEMGVSKLDLCFCELDGGSGAQVGL